MARSMATIASYSILDAMRSDLVSAEAGNYNTNGTPLAANACPAAGGSLSSFQLNQWCVQLGSALGATASTTGAIACGNTGSCTITIQFDDSRAGTVGTSVGSKTQKVVTVTKL
jgi:type IV pilus assembly protein PilV